MSVTGYHHPFAYVVTFYGEKIMTDSDKIVNVLRRNTKTPGITPDRLAKLTKLSRSSIYRRVAELRTNEELPIYSNYRVVKGKRTMFYRLAA